MYLLFFTLLSCYSMGEKFIFFFFLRREGTCWWWWWCTAFHWRYAIECEFTYRTTKRSSATECERSRRFGFFDSTVEKATATTTNVLHQQPSNTTLTLAHTCRRCKTRNKREDVKRQQLISGGCVKCVFAVANSNDRRKYCLMPCASSTFTLSVFAAYFERNWNNVYVSLDWTICCYSLSLSMCVLCDCVCRNFHFISQRRNISLLLSFWRWLVFCCCCCCQNDDFIELIALTHGMSALAAAHVHVLVYLSLCMWCWYITLTQPEMSKQNIKTQKILFLIRLLSVNCLVCVCETFFSQF